MDDLILKVENWAVERGLHEADPYKQILKVVEETGEIAGALARNNTDEAHVEIGDGVVTLIILSMQLNVDIEDCLEAAYEKIKDRKGKNINGIYVKEEDIELAMDCLEAALAVYQDREKYEHEI